MNSSFSKCRFQQVIRGSINFNENGEESEAISSLSVPNFDLKKSCIFLSDLNQKKREIY